MKYQRSKMMNSQSLSLWQISVSMTNFCLYDKSLSLWQISVSMTNLCLYDKSLSLWQIFVSLTNLCLYDKSLSLWQISVSMTNLCLYDKFLSLWQISVSLTNLCLYDKSLSLWQISVSMTNPPNPFGPTTEQWQSLWTYLLVLPAPWALSIETPLSVNCGSISSLSQTCTPSMDNSRASAKTRSISQLVRYKWTYIYIIISSPLWTKQEVCQFQSTGNIFDPKKISKKVVFVRFKFQYILSRRGGMPFIFKNPNPSSIAKKS